MATLADYIQKYLEELFEEQEIVELQRRMLADHFQCVPSQINYVLSTRFTLAKGYMVETRRGGGGYIRIQKLDTGGNVQAEAIEEIGDNLSLKKAGDFLQYLYHNGFLTERESKLMRVLLQEAGRETSEPGKVRANIIKSLFITLV